MSDPFPYMKSDPVPDPNPTPNPTRYIKYIAMFQYALIENWFTIFKVLLEWVICHIVHNTLETADMLRKYTGVLGQEAAQGFQKLSVE